MSRDRSAPADPFNKALELPPDLLLEWFQQPIAFHRPLFDLTGGSVTAALMLTYALHWTREFLYRANVPSEIAGEGFLHVTQAEWTKETGLSRFEQETARRILREREYLEEKRIGLPAKLYFRVNAVKIVADLKQQAARNLEGALGL